MLCGDDCHKTVCLCDIISQIRGTNIAKGAYTGCGGHTLYQCLIEES